MGRGRGDGRTPAAPIANALGRIWVGRNRYYPGGKQEVLSAGISKSEAVPFYKRTKLVPDFVTVVRVTHEEFRAGEQGDATVILKVYDQSGSGIIVGAGISFGHALNSASKNGYPRKPGESVPAGTVAVRVRVV